MAKKQFLLLVCVFAGFVAISGIQTAAQQDEPNIHVVVEMVQLNVAVTDNKGNYVTGLRPQDFSITEDGVPEKLATFGEGDGPTRRLMENLPPGTEVAAEPRGSEP